MSYPYRPSQRILMSGTQELITSTAFTMAGVATTTTLLSATAPVMGAGAYTSCSIANSTVGLVAGEEITILAVVQSTWAGDDAVHHPIWSANTTSGNRLRIVKAANNQLRFDAGSGTASGTMTSTNWAANTPHIIVARASGDGLYLWLDGVSLLGYGAHTRETSIESNVIVGGDALEGSILVAVWQRALAISEITELNALTDWSTLTTDTGYPLKVWDGAAWVERPLKIWNGAWSDANLKIWGGTEWEDVG